jgi:hypothetical protein
VEALYVWGNLFEQGKAFVDLKLQFSATQDEVRT